MVFKVGRAMLVMASLWLAGSGTRPSKSQSKRYASLAKQTKHSDPEPQPSSEVAGLGADSPLVEYLADLQKFARDIEAELRSGLEHLATSAQKMIHESQHNFDEFTKAHSERYVAAFVVVVSVSVSVPLLLIIFLCGGCLFSRRARDSAKSCRVPEAVPRIERDETHEGLLSSAVYLQHKNDFPRHITTSYLGGVFIWSLIALLLAIPTSASVFLSWALCPDLWWLGLLFLPFFYGMFLCDGFHRWWTWFKDLPECLSETPFGSAVPMNTVEPTLVSMRQLHMTLSEFLWAHHHVYLPFALRFVHRICFRLPYLKRRCELSGVAPKLQPDAVLAWWVLEMTAFFWFIRTEERDGVLLGYFSSEKFGPIRTILNIACSHSQPEQTCTEPVCDINKIEIWVDLRSRKAVRAQLDGVDVNFSRVSLLVGFIITSQSHAWLHAISMWSVMPENSHPFVRKMSVATMYNNHLGFDGGLESIAKVTGRQEFLTSGSVRSHLFADQLPYQDERNMLGPHCAAAFDFFSTARVRALVPYSRFVAFAYLLFPHFMKALEAEKPGSLTNSPKAYFYQTVLHCTDHWMFGQQFGVSVSGYACLASCVSEACSGPIAPGEPDIDYAGLSKGLMLTLGLTVDFMKLFPCYFWHAPRDLPFYHKVYKAALELDPELAFHMQVAFVK